MFSYRCFSAGPHALCRAAGLSRLTEEDRSLLSANATLSSQLAADGDAGDHSPFAKSLLKNFDGNPRLYMRDMLEDTAKDVCVASRGAQVPEITTRGGRA